MSLLGQFQEWARDLAALSERLRLTGAIPDSVEVQKQVQSYHETLKAGWSYRRSRTAVAGSHKLNRRTIDLLESGCIETNAHGIVVRANEAASKLLNFPLPFLSGQPLLVFIARDDRRCFVAEFMRLRHGDHSRHQWLVQCQPLFDPPFLASFTAQRVVDPDDHTVGIIWLIAKHQS